MAKEQRLLIQQANKLRDSAASSGSAKVQDSTLIHFFWMLAGRLDVVSLNKTLHFSSKNCTFSSVIRGKDH